MPGCNLPLLAESGCASDAMCSDRRTATNVGLALTFNGIGVLAAVSGIVQPVWAMLALAVSMSVVLINSFAAYLLPKTTQRV